MNQLNEQQAKAVADALLAPKQAELAAAIEARRLKKLQAQQTERTALFALIGFALGALISWLTAVDWLLLSLSGFGLGALLARLLNPVSNSKAGS